MKLNDKNLTKICIVLFLALYCVIYYVDSRFELETSNISELSIKDINKKIKVEGTPTKQKLIGENLFFTIENNNSNLIAIAFGINETLSKNQRYYFEGRITLYNNDIEIIVDKIYLN